ncbi:MAG: response regulator [Solirubrobacterales bacterium]
MGKKILLADDSITIQKVIELTFSDEDFDVVTVGNGRLALEKVQEIRPDIVLCDIIMPEKDGYEVCEFIKKNASLQHIPVLLLTGAFEPFDQERAARVGSDGYLAKPFEPETLIAKVKDLLSRAARPSGGPAIPFAAPGREAEPLRGLPPPSAPPPLSVVPPRPAEPLPFPRAASPEPFRAAPPPVEVAPLPVSFIPEEPFEDLDPTSFGPDGDAGAQSSEPLPFSSAADELLPMTPEESDSLGVSDTASTVMFSANSVPWQTPAAPIPSIQPPPAAPAAPPPSEASPVREAELPGEPTVFEEVIEEYVEFGGAYMPINEAGAEPVPGSPLGTYEPPTVPFEPPPTRPAIFEVQRATETVEIRPPAPTPPPAMPPPASRPPASAPRVPAPSAPPVAAPPAPPAYVRSEPAPIDEPMPTVAIASPWPTPPAPTSPRPEPAVPAAPTPAPASPPPVVPPAYVPPFVTHVAPPAPEPAAPPPPESFADLVPDAAAPAEPAKPASEAAEVSVPVEMVETIAQRVVAQISEKVVREIAWEVIPDLAEQLIKAEIERLKAELQRI